MTDEQPHQKEEEESFEFEGTEEELAREMILAHLFAQPVFLTWGILATIIILWGAAWLFGGTYMLEMLGLTKSNVSGLRLAIRTGMKLNDQITQQGQWWRLISAMFVHLDVMHIAFNAYGLYSIGPLVERFFGRWRMVTLFVGTGVISSLASVAFTANASGGASGALYGLVGALLVFGYKHRAILPERVSKALTVGMLPWVVFGIGIGFVGSIPMDNAGHIGGLLSGMVFGLILDSKLTLDVPPWRILFSRLFGVLLLMVVVAALGFWAAEVAHCTQNSFNYLQCYPELLQKK